MGYTLSYLLIYIYIICGISPLILWDYMGYIWDHKPLTRSNSIKKSEHRRQQHRTTRVDPHDSPLELPRKSLNNGLTVSENGEYPPYCHFDMDIQKTDEPWWTMRFSGANHSPERFVVPSLHRWSTGAAPHCSDCTAQQCVVKDRVAIFNRHFPLCHWKVDISPPFLAERFMVPPATHMNTLLVLVYEFLLYKCSYI